MMIPKNLQKTIAESNGIQFHHEVVLPQVDLEKEFLYKFIDMPDIKEIGERLWRHIPPNLKRTLYQSSLPVHYEKMQILIDSVNTIHPWSDILTIGLVIAEPRSVVPIHSDINVPHMYALNIPIYNTENAMTAFFQNKKDRHPWHATQSHGDAFNFYFHDDMNFLGAFSLIKPAIFNTHVPHSIVNPTDDFRCVLSFRFNSAFDFNKISDKFLNIEHNIDQKTFSSEAAKVLLNLLKKS